VALLVDRRVPDSAELEDHVVGERPAMPERAKIMQATRTTAVAVVTTPRRLAQR